MLLRLSESAIGGIVVGGCGFVILLVALFFWHHRRRKQPGNLPQVEVLGADLTSDHGGGGGADLSAGLTPFIYNAVTRYLASSVAAPSPRRGGDNSPERPNHLNRKMRPWMRERDTQGGAVLQQVVTAVPNVVTPEEDTRNARMQLEGRVQDSGSLSYVSENSGGTLPPDYQQATRFEPLRAGDAR